MEEYVQRGAASPQNPCGLLIILLYLIGVQLVWEELSKKMRDVHYKGPDASHSV